MLIFRVSRVRYSALDGWSSGCMVCISYKAKAHVHMQKLRSSGLGTPALLPQLVLHLTIDAPFPCPLFAFSRCQSTMRLSTLLSLPAALASLVFAASSNSYTEHLHLKPLPGGTLYAGFTFNASTPLSSSSNQHYRYFPRALAQILQYTHTAELHLRFGLGRWDEESWGSRPRSGLREGGNGVELWAWLEGQDGAGADAEAEARWSDLVNSLSGLFCASLNFIDSGKTVRPVMSFEAEGTLDKLQTRGNGGGELQLLHGMLPHEVVCTENLTPFLKLLPCKGKAGISSLLDGHKVFDANWQTMAVDVRPVCTTPDDCQLEIEQTVDMVLDIERSMRPRDNPIPRPLPVEQLDCDQNKAFNAEDTCYPRAIEGEQEWSLSRVFGRPIRGSCSLDADSSSASPDLTLEVSEERTVQVFSDGQPFQDGNAAGATGQSLRTYTLPEGQDFDLSLPRQTLSQPSTLSQPPLHATRGITGYGAERGGMHTTLHNPHPYPKKLVYLESLPWFLRPYMHTLSLRGGKIEKMYYTPLLDRKRGTHLELLLEIPAQRTAELSYDFEKAILRYTEYPPDANRGFDIPAAVIRVLASNSTGVGRGGDEYLRTTSLLLPLPTPDFSMPYNVIILTSTVIALGFGSVFNLLVRRFVLVEEVPVSAIQIAAGRVKAGVARIRVMVKGGGDGSDGAEKVKEELKATNGRPREGSKKDR